MPLSIKGKSLQELYRKLIWIFQKQDRGFNSHLSIIHITGNFRLEKKFVKEGWKMQAGNSIDLVFMVQVLWVSVCCAGMLLCRLRSGRKQVDSDRKEN